MRAFNRYAGDSIGSLGMYTIAVALIAIMLSIAGIVLGLGYAMDSRKLKEFAISEIYQAVINGAIVGSLIVGFSSGGFFMVLINNVAGISSVSASCPIGMSGNYPMCFAYNYLVGAGTVSVNGSSYQSLMSLTFEFLVPASALYSGLSLLSSVRLGIGIASMSFAGAFNPLLTALKYAIDAFTAAAIGIEVQAMLLRFISVVAIPILLPAGIILRTVYVTRRLGGAIMAVAIGLFAVMPFTYLLNAALANNYMSSLNGSSVNANIASDISESSSILGSATGMNTNNTARIINFFRNSVNALINGFGSVINGILGVIAFIIIEVFFLPIFSLILTAVSIKELARIMGSEISFGRLYIF